jgi:hypothetical protein
VASVKAGAYLGGAYLRGAYLVGAYLRGADLGDADLRGADLGGADLRGAYLGGAYLRGAYLGDADLGDADLGGADLGGAYLGGAYLGGAYLRGAYLGGAYLRGARNKPASLADHKDPETPYVRRAPTGDQPCLSHEERAARRKAREAERAARFRLDNPDVPVVPHLDAQILRSIEVGKLLFDMGNWHGEGPTGVEATVEACGTTHCRAGSAIHLAGEAGYALERKLGSAEEAGRAIYLASTGRAPYFYGSNERALADIKRCAAEDPVAVAD